MICKLRFNRALLLCMGSLLALLLNGSLCWAGSISGRATDVSDGFGLQVITVSLVSGTNTVFSIETGSNGIYSIQGIPDGYYKVVFSDPKYGEYVTQWYNNASDASGATELTVTATSNFTGINAALVAGSYITGSITDIQTNLPVMGATVSIYKGVTNILVDEVYSSGDYFSSVLPPGNYTLRFSKSDALATWYNQVSDQQSSTQVTVTAFNPNTGINAALTFFGRISGKVTDTSGAGISVATTVYDAGGNTIDNGYTDGNGNYITSRLPNGDYKICFNGWGTYENRCYSNALDVSGATPITVTAPSTAIVNAQLRRYVTISGTVHTSGGAPFAARVELYDSAHNLVRDTISSPSNGTYSFGDDGRYLVEGNYKVRFSDMNVGYAEQWYPAKSDFSGAATIAAFVPATTGIDAVMKMVGKISGQTVNSKSYGIPNIAVTVFDAGQNAVANLTSDAGGYYQTDYLPEGNYRIRFDGTASGYPLEWYSDQPDFARATPVTVNMYWTSNINATLVSPLKISGKVANSKGVGIYNALLYIYNSQNTYVTSFYSDVSGAFDSGELPADSYRIKIMASGYPEQWHGGTDFASAAPVTMTLSSGPAVANIALKEDGGRIYGRITNSSGVGIAGAYAQFYDAASGALVGYVNSDATGNYVSGKLNDGSYRIMFQSPFTGHLQEWYDNRGDITTATAVAVTAATPVVGIDAMLLKNMTLSVTLGGDGDGAVNSDPAGIACTNGTCTANYQESSTVKLSATPGRTSLFGGWGSACTNLVGDCTVAMTADKAVTATFTLAPKAKIGLTGYDSLAAAYAAAGTTDIVLALDSDMPDTGFSMGLHKSITLKGGYEADYLGKSGLPTVLKGPLTISTGSLTVEGVAVK